MCLAVVGRLVLHGLPGLVQLCSQLRTAAVAAIAQPVAKPLAVRLRGPELPPQRRCLRLLQALPCPRPPLEQLPLPLLVGLAAHALQVLFPHGSSLAGGGRRRRLLLLQLLAGRRPLLGLLPCLPGPRAVGAVRLRHPHCSACVRERRAGQGSSRRGRHGELLLYAWITSSRAFEAASCLLRLRAKGTLASIGARPSRAGQCPVVKSLSE